LLYPCIDFGRDESWVEDRHSRPDEGVFDLDRDRIRPIVLDDTDQLRVCWDISFEVFRRVLGERWE
jgi:hypothetical protein